MISSHPFLYKQKLTKVWNVSQRRGSRLPKVTQLLIASLIQEPGSPDPGPLLLFLHLLLHILQGPESNSSLCPYPVTRPPLRHSVREQLQASGIWRQSQHLTVGERSVAPPSEYLRWSPDVTLFWCGCRHWLTDSLSHLCIPEAGPMPNKEVLRGKNCLNEWIMRVYLISELLSFFFSWVHSDSMPRLVKNAFSSNMSWILLQDKSSINLCSDLLHSGRWVKKESKHSPHLQGLTV